LELKRSYGEFPRASIFCCFEGKRCASPAFLPLSLQPQRGQATTKKLAHGMELSRNFFISFISVRVHFREPDFFAFFAKISFVIDYAGFSGKLKTGALRAAFNKKFPNG
jgi:hypothetical protein